MKILVVVITLGKSRVVIGSIMGKVVLQNGSLIWLMVLILLLRKLGILFLLIVIDQLNL